MPVSINFTDKQNLLLLFQSNAHPLTNEHDDAPNQHNEKPVRFGWHKYISRSYELERIEERIKNLNSVASS